MPKQNATASLLDPPPETTTKRAPRTTIHEGTGTKDMVLTDRRDLPAPVVVPASLTDQILALADKIGVDALERLIAMRDRERVQRAESAFNAAMTQAQREMRPVAVDAANPQTRSKYASYAALDTALRPIYTAHGLSLSFNQGEASPLPDHLRISCKARHVDGHSELYHLDMPADGKGAKGGDVMTKTHATGSAVSYGMRYLLRMIFAIAIEDDDGNAAGKKAEPPVVAEPEGYQHWLDMLAAAAEEGWPEFKAIWNPPASEAFRNHLVRVDLARSQSLQLRAKEVSRGAK